MLQQMRYDRFQPCESLKDIVKEFWIFEDESQEIQTQKIIPDGYSEIVIQYGDPYEVNLAGSWERQSSLLFSSQIRKFFFLRNSGTSGMIGIKLHPISFYELFGVDISGLTDQIVPLKNVINADPLEKLIMPGVQAEEKIKHLEHWLISQNKTTEPMIRNAVDLTLETKGNIAIETLAEVQNVSSRQLERKFKKMIGLPPKFYSRIIRFGTIFKLMESGDESWVRIALQSGYFDQSHFIKNFKEFTGEDPSNYGFDETNLANFFLKN